MNRLGLPFAVVALLSLGLAVPVLAATPSNDTYPDRVVIGSIPLSTSLDTTGATTDGLDIEAKVDCGAPSVDASVWFEFTPVADGNLIFDVGASDYSAGLIILTGSPGNFSLQAYGPASRLQWRREHRRDPQEIVDHRARGRSASDRPISRDIRGRIQP